jgi:hypothetical protein
MQNRESQGLELLEVWLAQQAIDIDTQIMYIHKQKSVKSFIIGKILRRFKVVATSLYNVRGLFVN